MPVYDYLCPSCGPITALRRMSAHAEPLECPTCQAEAPRAFLQAPHFSGISTERFQAFERNEKARHQPSFSKGADRADAARERKARKLHPSNCSCCSGISTAKSGTVFTADGGKTFPSKRPWMISH